MNINKDIKQWCKHNDECYMKRKDFDDYYGVCVSELEVDQVQWL